MKRLFSLLALPLLVAAAPASAAELVYNWKTGTTVAYHYQDETALTMELPNLGAMAGMPEMKTNLDADVAGQFDTARGAIVQVSGTVKMNTEAGGMTMKTDSTFSLQAK